MFDPFVLDREDPIYQAVMQRQMRIVEGDDGPIDETWFTGVRSTQIIYLHNPVTSYQAAAFSQPHLQRSFIHEDPEQQGLEDFVVDNVFWKGWNTRQHMGSKWQGITRFEVRAPSDVPTTPLATWLESRHFAEERWRQGQEQVKWYKECVGQTNWLDVDSAQPNAEVFNMTARQWQTYWTENTVQLVRSQNEVAEFFYDFANAVSMETPKPHTQYTVVSQS